MAATNDRIGCGTAHWPRFPQSLVWQPFNWTALFPQCCKITLASIVCLLRSNYSSIYCNKIKRDKVIFQEFCISVCEYRQFSCSFGPQYPSPRLKSFLSATECWLSTHACKSMRNLHPLGVTIKAMFCASIRGLLLEPCPITFVCCLSFFKSILI